MNDIRTDDARADDTNADDLAAELEQEWGKTPLALSIVIPLYNEEESIPSLYTRLTAALEEWFAGHFRDHDSRLHRRLGPHRH